MKHKGYSAGPWVTQDNDGRIFSKSGQMVGLVTGAGFIPIEEIIANRDLFADAPRLAAQEELGLRLAEAVELLLVNAKPEDCLLDGEAETLRLAREFKESYSI